ncbi:polyprenyl diphosphate synthase [Conexibacter arvalis]|uniref:Isoprenyl transferase n=1 Tax=Conexibacter arvalis TaxID=912552 RepID=A0A840IEY3_9ACTN|nr:polyprenyl diphosphate synthase [Conexibacter arvalis]MBB4662875.1 undecaprenyl diphosphate synthase [Conexibacter arvalis]
MAERLPPAAGHVAIITDGNGRWAKRRGLPPAAGHDAGARNVRDRLLDAAELGIQQLTVYAFSTENWSRPDSEVDALMEIIARYVQRETPPLHDRGVRIRFIGRRTAPLPGRLLDLMSWAERLTAGNDRIELFIPLNYGGRAEIIDAARDFTGTTEEEFRARLYAPDMLDPDVVIRTGGEHRLSNYLLWQSAGARFLVRDELWPDFDRTALISALTPPKGRPDLHVARGRAGDAAPASPP